jgi:hypothetical protein
MSSSIIISLLLASKGIIVTVVICTFIIIVIARAITGAITVRVPYIPPASTLTAFAEAATVIVLDIVAILHSNL